MTLNGETLNRFSSLPRIHLKGLLVYIFRTSGTSLQNPYQTILELFTLTDGIKTQKSLLHIFHRVNIQLIF